LNGYFLIEATNRIRINRSHVPLGSSSAHLSGIWGWRWWLILGHLLAILRAIQNISALRPSFIPVNQTRWPPNFVYVLSTHIRCPKNICWCKTRWCVLRRCGFRRPYCSLWAQPCVAATRAPARRAINGIEGRAGLVGWVWPDIRRVYWLLARYTPCFWLKYTPFWCF
jgi:hypothetical protein